MPELDFFLPPSADLAVVSGALAPEFWMDQMVNCCLGAAKFRSKAEKRKRYKAEELSLYPVGNLVLQEMGVLFDK